MLTRITALMAALAPVCAGALDLTETGRYSLNRPASLDYDPTFCGLWIANEGPEAVLVTLQGDELRRITSDLFRIKAISIEGDNLIVGDGMGRMGPAPTCGRFALRRNWMALSSLPLRSMCCRQRRCTTTRKKA